MKIINGIKHSQNLIESVKELVLKSERLNKRKPSIAVILIGANSASEIYVKNKIKTAENIGIISKKIVYPSSITEKELLNKIKDLNEQKDIDGILVQLPLPKHINSDKVLDSILPVKDVDGFHAVNVGKLWSGLNSLVPCTPLGCSILLKMINDDLSGLHAVIIGRSNIVGKPMAALLLGMNATVSICHSRTKDLPAIVRQADIVVPAVGIPEMVKGDWIREGAVVIDVGINRIERDGKNILVGDANYNECYDKASKITPVPGGVGPMTIACLLLNTLLTSYTQFDLEVPDLSSILKDL